MMKGMKIVILPLLLLECVRCSLKVLSPSDLAATYASTLSTLRELDTSIKFQYAKIGTVPYGTKAVYDFCSAL